MYVQIAKRSTVQKPWSEKWVWVHAKSEYGDWVYRRRAPRPRPPRTRLVFRLVRSVRTDRGPRPVLVAELGRIDVEYLDRALVTRRLWDWIDYRLAEHAVGDAEAERIRARIAQHVPRPDHAAIAAAEDKARQNMLELEYWAWQAGWLVKRDSDD